MPEEHEDNLRDQSICSNAGYCLQQDEIVECNDSRKNEPGYCPVVINTNPRYPHLRSGYASSHAQ